jgi:hypothetical protein
MYAPPTVLPGSSVSHWDTAVTPDEILEPFATAHPSDLLTTQLLHDVGWTLQSSSPPPPPTSGSCTADAATACLQSGRFEVKVDWQTASASGAGQVMSFGGQRTENEESVFWWFFSPTNFEILGLPERPDRSGVDRPRPGHHDRRDQDLLERARAPVADVLGRDRVQLPVGLSPVTPRSTMA